MEFEWDANKSESNRASHGVDFTVISNFRWESSVIIRSDRFGEERYVALGYIGSDSRLWTIVYTPRGDAHQTGQNQEPS